MSEHWHPGSFTKNFAWGPSERGLRELYEVIQAGFANQLTDTPRSEFRKRVANAGRPDYIPLNFFLLNRIRNGVSYVCVDELVFQALNFRHDASFDKLALYAFNLSKVGSWKGATAYQHEPALWARHYIIDRVNGQLDWQTSSISADDIEHFLLARPEYVAKTSRKLSTNLAYLYKVGRLADYKSRKPERWWLSALFLTLDRTPNTAKIAINALGEAALLDDLARSGFHSLSGRRSVAKDIAAGYFSVLYTACGGLSRFVDKDVLERQAHFLPNVHRNEPASIVPVGVFHPTNPAARNIVPDACKILARYAAGFEVFDSAEMDDFDVSWYVRNRTESALTELDRLGIRPSLSGDQVNQIVRGE